MKVNYLMLVLSHEKLQCGKTNTYEPHYFFNALSRLLKGCNFGKHLCKTLEVTHCPVVLALI